ncbi:type I-E CRISPR-associated protein Cas6/Cse3/CasE [Dietzia sp. 179-F 9C3 NHS]|uniref:type I-E CRISPR-associated protein Cas6/Cse3/CasE n=1 Tax=Dietzia sp. 179-F 9C3 NHS TaxID=3374295 RepID=UPI0038797FA2
MTTTTDTLTCSYLALDAAARQAREAIADPHRMHQLVMAGYSTVTGDAATARADHNILYAVDLANRAGMARLVCQSTATPDWQPLEGVLAAPATIHDGIDLREGDAIQFRTDLNPVSSTPAPRNPLNPDAPRSRGIRRPIRNLAEQLAWAQRKLTDAGLDITGLSIAAERTLISTAKQGMKVNVTTFTGTATVTDPDRLATARRTGIGRAKAYGCGLLLLR